MCEILYQIILKKNNNLLVKMKFKMSQVAACTKTR